MVILGIETSCDETAAAVLQIKNNKVDILSNVISSQIKTHQKYGGVVPELAARKHTENIIPVINQALILAQKKLKKPTTYNLQPTNLINAIAVTSGPGLVTSLMVGVETAKTLAWTWKVPLIPINHLEAHIYANLLPPTSYNLIPKNLPSLCLLISGGHTELILIKGHGTYKIIGETLDDAAGESFDKVAKMLGLKYPGGPNVAKMAKRGKADKISLPRPLINSQDFNFSFSGLKTAVNRVIQENKKTSNSYNLNNICASFQQSVIDVLISKTIKAAQKYKIKSILLAGGVSANKELRQQLDKKIKTELPKISFHFPDLKFCTDNAAMIAMAGYFKYNKNLKPYNLEKIKIDPNKSL